MATSRSKLRKRWLSDEGGPICQRIHNLIEKKAERSVFEETLSGFPFANEVPGFVDFRGIPLRIAVSEVNLDHLDMSFAQADKSDPWTANHMMVSAGRFHNSRFDQIKAELEFIKADITGSTLVGSNLRGVSWWLNRPDTDFDARSDARYLHDLDFSETRLTFSQFRNQWLRNCNFSGANLKSASFFGVLIEDCCFAGADLTEAIFAKCEFRGRRDFSEAKLVNTDLDPEIAGSPIKKVPLAFEVKFIEAAIEHFETVCPNDSFLKVLSQARSDPSILDSLERLMTKSEQTELEFELKQVSKNLWGE